MVERFRKVAVESHYIVCRVTINRKVDTLQKLEYVCPLWFVFHESLLLLDQMIGKELVEEIVDAAFKIFLSIPSKDTEW